MAKGTIKWFNKDKGYGFIQPETGGADVFVHVSQLHEAGIQSLTDGQAIEFEMIEGVDDRKMAGALKLVDDGGAAGGGEPDASADEADD